MITITQPIDGIYPAYNDSYIMFSSTLSGSTYAEITVPEHTNTFKIYPDLNDEYLFNLKEIIKIKLNEDGFNDNIDVPTLSWGASIDGTYTTQELNISVYNDTNSEILTGTTYEFYKSVKQIGENVYSNPAQVLNHSTNGVDYNLTYFEGYPFSFDLQRITSGDSIKIKNNNTEISGTPFTAKETNAYRIYIDKGISNWTTKNYLPLLSVVNELEIYVNDVFKTNLSLKKEDATCGIYLKWFNNEGGYSYYLFDKYFKDTISTKNLNTIATNSFTNVGSLVAPSTLIGIEGSQTYTVKTTVDKNESEILKGLFLSPSVQLYSKQEPFQSGEWLNVQIKGNYTITTKKNNNEITFSISLPELLTTRL